MSPAKLADAQDVRLGVEDAKPKGAEGKGPEDFLSEGHEDVRGEDFTYSEGITSLGEPKCDCVAAAHVPAAAPATRPRSPPRLARPTARSPQIMPIKSHQCHPLTALPAALPVAYRPENPRSFGPPPPHHVPHRFTQRPSSCCSNGAGTSSRRSRSPS